MVQHLLLIFGGVALRKQGARLTFVQQCNPWISPSSNARSRKNYVQVPCCWSQPFQDSWSSLVRQALSCRWHPLLVECCKCRVQCATPGNAVNWILTALETQSTETPAATQKCEGKLRTVKSKTCRAKSFPITNNFVLLKCLAIYLRSEKVRRLAKRLMKWSRNHCAIRTTRIADRAFLVWCSFVARTIGIGSKPCWFKGQVVMKDR